MGLIWWMLYKLRHFYLSDEDSCRLTIGVVYAKKGTNPFEKDYEEQVALGVKNGFVRYKFRHPQDRYKEWIGCSCTCSSYILTIFTDDMEIKRENIRLTRRKSGCLIIGFGA